MNWTLAWLTMFTRILQCKSDAMHSYLITWRWHNHRRNWDYGKGAAESLCGVGGSMKQTQISFAPEQTLFTYKNGRINGGVQPRWKDEKRSFQWITLVFSISQKKKSMVILPYNDRDHLCITAQSLAVQLNLPLWVQAGCGSNGHTSKNCLWSHFLKPKTHSSRGRAGSLAVIQLSVISCLILLLLNWIKSSPHLPASAS